MILIFDYVPQKDKRYSCVDCMHLEINTDNKTYHFYENTNHGAGIKLKNKADLIKLLNSIQETGYKEEK